MLNTSPFDLWLGFAGLVGLCVGSFLNVVSYRLPIMLQTDWQNQCREILTLPPATKQPPFNLLTPRSHCPHCQTTIPWFTLIPVCSYVFLKGKCRYCQQRIDPCYPLIELGSAVLTVAVVYHFGLNWRALAACLFTWSLLCLSRIDSQHHILPDAIVLPLLGLGLGLSVFHLFTSPEAAIIGLLAGYLSLYLVALLFKTCTKKDGMGTGDVKLLAMLGAWCGWQALPLIILIATLLGSLTGIGLICLNRHRYQQPLAFGPYLAAGGWLALLYKQSINHWYLHTVLKLC